LLHRNGYVRFTVNSTTLRMEAIDTLDGSTMDSMRLDKPTSHSSQN
jgi:hypothetical protein